MKTLFSIGLFLTVVGFTLIRLEVFEKDTTFKNIPNITKGDVIAAFAVAAGVFYICAVLATMLISSIIR